MDQEAGIFFGVVGPLESRYCVVHLGAPGQS